MSSAITIRAMRNDPSLRRVLALATAGVNTPATKVLYVLPTSSLNVVVGLALDEILTQEASLTQNQRTQIRNNIECVGVETFLSRVMDKEIGEGIGAAIFHPLVVDPGAYLNSNLEEEQVS